MRLCALLTALVFPAASALLCEAADQTARPAEVLVSASSSHFVTNAAQFRTLTGADYLEGCDFRLAGVVTLVDTNRDLVVLQDATGAVAIHFPLRDNKLHFGQLVSMEGTNCCPYCAQFPDYPYRPSLREIRDSFEAPTGSGEFYMTRMRGYLHPPVTGEYNFWIASDNSSELWLSVDASVPKARKIAFIPRFGYAGPHEWSRFPSQHSEPIWLKAGQTYYIEAIQEQTTLADNLAVAWQGPTISQSVISGRYLTPWSKGGDWQVSAGTNGILREFWTNFSSGDLSDLGGARPFESALSVENVGVRILGQGQMPKPAAIALNQPWEAEDNYRWVEAEGVVKFTGANGDVAFLELSSEQAQIQVRLSHGDTPFLRRLHNAQVRVRGVCEGVYDEKEELVPGLIWASGEDCISLLETSRTNVEITAEEPLNMSSMARTNPAMQGFYLTRAVVTFNDRVFSTDYLVVQENTSAMLVSLEECHVENHLKVGEWVDLGGALQPGKYLPVIRPLVITELGWHSLPVPMIEPLASSVPGNRAGKWSELEGVVHEVNSNGTISVMAKDGQAYFWIGQTSSNYLARYVDAKLRARGILLLNILDAPVLLVPSRNFVDVEEASLENPFDTRKRSIAGLFPELMDSSWLHRVRVVGEVTYRDAQSFFLQDVSGGIRVLPSNHPATEVGETVEALAFPMINGSVRTLTEAEVHPAKSVSHITPKNLDLSEPLSSKQNGTLVLAGATLLARKTNGTSQVLELQEQQRVFAATLPVSQGNLPDIALGSRIQVVGVCDKEIATPSLTGGGHASAQYLASLNILLRSPGDVTVLSGPPWWTWKRTVFLVGTLLAVLGGTLLWIDLLRRRLERQQAAQLVFSRQVLERLEAERGRIAANLHDSLGQILLVIKNHALLAIQRPPDEEGWRHRLDDISDAASQAIEEVRQITHGLRPYQLDRLGLTQAIRTSISRASTNSPILFATRVEEIDGLFDKDSEIHVYRIVQEAVTNVVKHSTATEVAVVIKKRPAVVSLSIRDNGQGFDATNQPSGSHDLGYGLGGIAERVRILGGILAIDSRPGEGTSLSVEVPLHHSKHETRNISTHCG